MLKKSKEEIAVEILQRAQELAIRPPESWQTPEEYFRILECSIQDWVYNVAITIINNIYDEQEMDNKINGVLLGEPK